MPTSQDYQSYVNTASNVFNSIFGGSSKPEEQQRMESYQAQVKPLALQEARSKGLTVYAGWYGMIIGTDPNGAVSVAGRYNLATEVDPLLSNIASRTGRNVIAIESLDPFETHVVYPGTGGEVIMPGGYQPQTAGGSSWFLIGAAAVAAWLIFKRR